MIRWNLEKHQLSDQIIINGYQCNALEISVQIVSVYILITAMLNSPSTEL
jgi:hypothetical protein